MSESPKARSRRSARKKKPAKMGRPTKYNAALAKRICRLVGYGLSKEDAAADSGIHPSTLFEWQAARPDFAEALTRARARLKPKLVEIIAQGAKADPRLALEYAARLWPDEFGRKSTTRLEGGDPERPVVIDPSEELREVARKLAGMTTEQLRAMRGGKP